MKVYIVQTSEYDDTSIYAVFASRELAEQEKAQLDSAARDRAARMLDRFRKRTGREPWNGALEQSRDHYMVTEYEVLTEVDHAARPAVAEGQGA